MNMTDWAKKEIELACKKENPNWDGKTFDYGCNCYQSALKAYNSLMEDEHSGTSFGFTKGVLIRLMQGLPLIPITDADFEYVQPCGGKDKDGTIYIQCPRFSSLFKNIDLEGNATYDDINRVYCADIHSSNTYSCGLGRDIVNELYPITLPYYPIERKFKIYVEDFLVDSQNGDYDTQGFLYMITPNGEKVELNKFYAVKNGEFKEISTEEYQERKILSQNRKV